MKTYLNSEVTVSHGFHFHPDSEMRLTCFHVPGRVEIINLNVHNNNVILTLISNHPHGKITSNEILHSL